MDGGGLLEPAALDGRRLLISAMSDWSRPVAHCPGWDTAELVRHTGTILEWMAAVVTAGQPVNLGTAPAALTDLHDWHADNLDRCLRVLADTDPEAPVWTFSSLGDHRVAWWRRRLAVELAIHRWDAEHAVGTDASSRPAPLNGAVAAAGIEEFVTEFLPGLLTRATGQRPSGTLHLHMRDDDTDRWIDLDNPADVVVGDGAAAIKVGGTRSDILLWMNHRDPDSLTVLGDRAALDGWIELRR